MLNKYCKCICFIFNGFEKQWRGTKSLTETLKSKKDHNSYKNLDIVMYSCLLMEVLMVNKFCKIQSNIWNGFDKKVNWYKQLNQCVTPSPTPTPRRVV